MNSWPIASQGSRCAAAGLLALVSGAAMAAPTTVERGTDWPRYQVILDRAPFGRAPQPGDPDADAAAAAAAAAAAEPEGPTLNELIRLSMESNFGGKPAAGFTDTSTTPNTDLYLLEGETVGDYTLVSVDVSGPHFRYLLRKGAQEAWFELGEQTATSSIPAVAVAAPPVPNDTVSYAARQRQRMEEARQRLEEARRRAEDERKNQDARVEKLTGEALQKHLRDYNLEMIRTGKGPPLPIELTHEEVEQLASEGFDVGAPAAATTEAADSRSGTPEAQ